MKRISGVIFITLSILLQSALAERIKILDSTQDAFQARIELAQNAKEEIIMSYFIFAEDNTAADLLAVLREKAKEGVKVKILIDQMYNAISKHTGTHLVNHGIEIRNFNKFKLFRILRSVKYRMHDKMFIVDGHISGEEHIILGGRNIQDAYYGLTEKNYHDRDVYLQGKIAKTARDYWFSVWDSKHVTPFKIKKKTKSKKSKKKLSKAVDLINNHEKNIMNHIHMTEDKVRAWNSDMLKVESSNITFAHDLVRLKKSRITGTAKTLYNLIDNAKSEVIIDSPYFIATKQLKKLLKKKLAQGVKIRILTNSLKATDSLFPQAAYLRQRRKLAQMEIELYEYYAKDCFHSKSMVIDGEIAVIGSFNFDPRSQNLSTETASIMNDKAVSSLLLISMDDTLKIAQKINKEGRPEGKNSRLPGVKFRKKLATQLIQILVIPWAKGLL